MEQRVLVCGGRDYDDREQLFRILDVAHLANPIVCLIHGAARGADTLAADWALEHDVLCNAYPADWDQHGNAAGPMSEANWISRTFPVMAASGFAFMISTTSIAAISATNRSWITCQSIKAA